MGLSNANLMLCILSRNIFWYEWLFITIYCPHTIIQIERRINGLHHSCKKKWQKWKYGPQKTYVFWFNTEQKTYSYEFVNIKIITLSEFRTSANTQTFLHIANLWNRSYAMQNFIHAFFLH